MKENKNLIWLVLAFIILAVLLFGLYFYKNSPKNMSDNLTQKNISGEENISNEFGEKTYSIDEFSDLISGDYKKSESFKNCISNDMGVKSCLNEEIRKKVNDTENVELCNDLIEDYEKKNCKEDFYTNLSIKNMDVSVCDNLENGKEYCVSNVILEKAKKQKNESVCDQITNENQKRNCKSSVVRDIAVEKKDKKMCEKLIYTNTQGEETFTETIESDMCKDEIDFKIEEEKMNEEIANEISLEEVEEENLSENI